MGELWDRWDGVRGGWSGRQQTGAWDTLPGRRRRQGREQPVRSGGGGDAWPPLRSVPAAPGAAPRHGRPLPGARRKEPCAVGVGAPRCLSRAQAPSCPCSRGASPVDVVAPGAGRAAAAEPSLTRVVPPGSLLLVTHCCLAQPPGSASLGFCFPVCPRGKLEQHPCSAPSCAEKPEPFPMAPGTDGHHGHRPFSFSGALIRRIAGPRGVLFCLTSGL